MWDLILNPFVTILAWLYAALNQDIVLAIVVLTVIIRFLTYPLLGETARVLAQDAADSAAVEEAPGESTRTIKKKCRRRR